MRIVKLRVQNIRNHTDITCDFSPNVTLIHGLNGTGKTSLLEAIYIAYRGVSFKGTDTDVVKIGREWYRIDVRDDSGYARTVILDDRTDRRTKKFTVDHKTTARLPVKYKRPVVLFTPDDLRLIDGSPARRRRYMDTLIAQYDEKYGIAIRRYERALLQRNKALKRLDAAPDQLFSWNVMLSEYGSYIMSRRDELAQSLERLIPGHYETISRCSEPIEITYTARPSTAQKMLLAYEQNFHRDHQMGATQLGPHRHDLAISLRGKLASDIASRGENRTFVLALKYAEAEILLQKHNDRPIVLLDDVFGELDKNRRSSISQLFSDYQVIITSTEIGGKDIVAIPLEG